MRKTNTDGIGSWVVANPSEIALASAWAKAKLTGTAPKNVSFAQIKPIKQGQGFPQANRSLVGTPLTIGKKVYARGIAVHALSEMLITLPGPASRFRADIGRDQSGLTKGNVANIRFVVAVKGKDVFTSDVIHGGEKPIRIDVPLKGAKEFTLRVDGAFDWGHADWADACVILQNNQKLWLDEIPLPGTMPDFSPEPPFSFVYGQKSSREFLNTWTRSQKTKKLDRDRTQYIITYTDPKTGLEITLDGIAYSDFPAVEWVLCFKNTGNSDTPIIENVQALDTNVSRMSASSEFVLHHATGSICASSDFQPLEKKLSASTSTTLAPEGGRSSSGTMPFFNLECSGGGIIGAVGWTGQWAATFTRDDATNLNVRAGMELTHLTLHPGEHIRTPRMLLVFWRGQYLAAQNMFRQFVLRHASPKPGGKLIRTPISSAHWGMLPEQDHLNRIEGKARTKVAFDTYWIDAGWYGKCEKTSDWYPQAGSWFPNKQLYPNGLKAISDAAHKNGMKFLLWFDPERVYKGSQLDTEHPEWLLGRDAPWRTYAWEGFNENAVLNLGIPEARQWITDCISQSIVENGIDIYRQDFNIDPLPFWRNNDAPDRQGYTEAKHIEGLYQFWDELLERHPHLEIDNCASGGRRIDLEMIRRSVPLWRSDLQCCPDYDPVGSQSQTFGLSYWLPLNATGSRDVGDTYDFRSALATGTNNGWRLDSKDFPTDWGRKMIDQAVMLRDFFLGDFYPLTNYSLSNDVWLAYQLDRPDMKQGAILVYRRAKSSYTTAMFKLCSLDPRKQYRVTFLDGGSTRKISGRTLMETGLEVSLPSAPASEIITYKVCS